MTFRNGYFYTDEGTLYYPLGMFGNYFSGELTGDTLVSPSQHGTGAIEFQRCTEEVWRHWFTFLQREGVNAIRLFPRGDSGDSSWEGLDIGGRVNRSLLEIILHYAEVAREYGIRCMLGLFTQPECSVYCRHDTRVYWGARLFDREMREQATPAQRRFFEHTEDLVSYEEFFRDPDVRSCCHSFLDELLPLIAKNDNFFCLELYNEMGWASPNADPMNTFRWEHTANYLDWGRDMTDHIHRMYPGACVCISNPGVGILGHDTVQWADSIRPDLFTLHNYPDLCGTPEDADYASMSDMCLHYTQLSVPAMYAEWQAKFRPEKSEERLMELTARDFAWFGLLSGAPGCISWRGRGYGQYREITRLLSELSDRFPFRARPQITVNISDVCGDFAALFSVGEEHCSLPDYIWCPDRAATDRRHRFCKKATDLRFLRMTAIERWSLTYGVPYAFSRTGGIPLAECTEDTFSAAARISVPHGYQCQSFCSWDGRTELYYLRNYHLRPFMNGKHISFCLREQRPEQFAFTSPSQTPNEVCILRDLDTGEERMVKEQYMSLGTSTHDYLLSVFRL